MTDAFDPYKTLQVDPEADPDVIQAAYRRLAQKFHPDRGGGPAEAGRMVAINRAWELLSDPARRAAHDRGRRQAAPGGAAEPPIAPRPARPAGGSGPEGPVLTFGRYAGSSLTEIARLDPEYLEWLDRMPIGRPWRDQIDVLLRSVGRRHAPEVEAQRRHGLFRRR